MTEAKRPLKVFLCHTHADRDLVPQGDDMRGIPEGIRLTTPALVGGAREDGVDRYAWLDKENHLSGQGFDTVSQRRTVNLSDWELEIRKAVREIIDV
jgi:hypothetical protein